MRCMVVVLVLATTRALASAGDPPELTPALGVTASATSTLTAKGKSHEPRYALGGDPAKFWCEGKPDAGIGEALVLKFATPTQIESVRIRAGVWRSPELFRQNNRITELDVITDDGRTKKVTLREERENVDVSLGRGSVSELRFQIAAVAKGSKFDDTCISGIEITTDPRSTLVLGADAAAMSSLAPTFAKVWHAFATCDEKALRAPLQFPFVLHVTDERDRRYGDAKAVRKACKAGTFKRFVDAGGALQVRSDVPGRVMLEADVFAWTLAFEGGAWRLVSVTDATP